MICDMYALLPTREAQLSLGVQGLFWLGVCLGGMELLCGWLLHLGSQPFQRLHRYCVTKDPTINHSVSPDGLIWPMALGQQRCLYEAGYSKGLEIISQEFVKGQTFLWTVQSFNTPDLMSQLFIAHVMWLCQIHPWPLHNRWWPWRTRPWWGGGKKKKGTCSPWSKRIILPLQPQK